MSAKGTTWSKDDHKYIRKINGQYIYEHDRGTSSPTDDTPEVSMDGHFAINTRTGETRGTSSSRTQAAIRGEARIREIFGQR